MELFKSRTRVAYTNAVGDKVYPVIVDIKKGIKSTEEIQFMSSDINTGILSVAFIQGNDNYNVTGVDVVCSVMRPDASTLELPCEVVGENIVEVPLGVNGTSQDGVYSFDFKVFKGGNKVVGTPIMNYSVSLSIGNGAVVEEDDRLPVLTMLMTQVTELKDEAREVINQANTATEATKVATANAVEATNNANTTINTANQKMLEVDNAKNEMTATVSNKVNEVETRFNALTSSQQQDAEVIDARDGETSLKARLDRDIEKAKEIYTPIEGSYISTDSSSGYLKDVEILGNTIQDAENLADIRSVGDTVEGQELYEIPVLSRGKNLFDGIYRDNSFLQVTGVGAGDLGDVSGHKATLNYVKLKPNSTYKFSTSNSQGVGIILFFYDKNKKYIRHIDTHIMPNTALTTNENEYYIRWYGTDAKISAFTNIQIEEGTVATPYEPYQEDKLTILSPTQLEKVGDVADRIVCKDGVWGVEKNIVTKRVDATKLYAYNGSTELNKIYGYDNFADDYAKPTIQLSNKFLYDQSIYANGNEGIFINNSGGIRFGILSTKEYGGTLDKCKKWVEDNDLFVSYVTTTPQFIPLPHDQQVKLRTFANKTNISFLTEIEGTIKAQVPKSLGATVNTHTEQISNLNKELDRVKKLEESTVSTVETESDFTTVEATSNGYFEDVKLEGKTLVNLFDYSTPFNTHWKDITISQGFKPNTTYTFIIQSSGDASSLLLGVLDTSGSAWSCLKEPYYVGSSIFALTTDSKPSNTIRMGTVTPSGVEATYNKIIILEGDHRQNPPSGYIEGLKSVGQSASEDGIDEIVVSSVNENLVPSDWDYKFQCFGDIKVNQINTRNFEIVNTNTVDGIAISKNFINKFCHNNKVVFDFYSNQIGYFYVLDYGFSGENYKPIQGVKNIEIGRNVFVVDVSGASGRIAFRFNNNIKNSTLIISDFSIKTSKNSNNVNHKSDKKRLLYYNDETQTWEKPILREWDSIEKHADGKYYYHQRSGEVVLNGSEDTWGDATSSFNLPTTNSYHVKINDYIQKPKSIVCDKFISDISRNEDVQGIYHADTYVGGNRLVFRVYKDTYSTLAGFKQWLQANNVTVVYQLAQEKVYECTNIDLITYNGETNYIVESGAIAPKSILKVHNNISNVVKILQEKVSLLESNVKASQEVQDMMILETDMRMLDIELALMEFVPMKLNLGGSDMLRSATYFNFLKNHIVNETYEKEYLENVMNKYLATGRINQDEYDELYKMLYPPVYDIELPIEP